jgi:hypothetical protein
MQTTEQKVAAFASARFIFEDEVRKRAAIPDSPASEPGVYRDLSPEDRKVYEELLSLHWGWALKYITMLSYGKRLWMDSLPSMEVLLTSDELAFLLASYPSAADGLLEYDRPDGSKGLTGGFETNMLHEFGTQILTDGDATLARPEIAVLDLLSPNPANARSMHHGDTPSDEPFKMDCREYWSSQTEGERIAQDWSLSEMAYSCKELRELSGKPFVCAQMGNLLRLDADIHCQRGRRQRIQAHHMAHWEAMVRWLVTLTDENVDRSEGTFAYLKAALYPHLPVDPARKGPLREARLKRPRERAAWLAAAKINAKKGLRTRGRRLARAAGHILKDDAAAERYAMDHLRSLGLAARRANAKLLGIVKKDGSGDAGTYSLGRGSTYLNRFRHASEAEKATIVTEIRANAAAARVRGAVESKKTVKKSLRNMGMREDEIMTWRLGGGGLWEACWELFDKDEKVAAREEIRGEALAQRKKGAVESKKTIQGRLSEMVMTHGYDEGMTYRLGGGALWYECWELLRTRLRRAKKSGARPWRLVRRALSKVKRPSRGA